jgi:ABC-type transporter MlaC component
LKSDLTRAREWRGIERIRPTLEATEGNNQTEEAMRKPTVSKVTKRGLQTKLVSVSLVFLISYLLFSSPSRAESPTEQVRATVDKVLTLVRNPAAQKKNLRAQLAEVIYPRFDFAEMAKRSLGPHWARRTPEEQREFVKVFAALMGRSYADNIESYTSQNVLYTRESEDQNYAQVDTKIVTENRPRCRSTTNSTASTRWGKCTT